MRSAVLLTLALVALSLVTVVYSFILLGQRTEPASQNSYEPMVTVWDVVVLDYISLLTILLFSAVGLLRASELGMKAQAYALALYMVFFLGKLWMFQQWAERARGGYVIFTACAACVRYALALMAFYAVEDDILADAEAAQARLPSATGGASDTDDDDDDAAGSATRRRRRPFYAAAMLRILLPYLVPRGFFKKVLTASTWGILVAGKACIVYSPIVLSEIIEDLGRTPVVLPKGKMCLYAALAFAPTLCQEIQGILYIRTWRHSYCEVAESTYTHIHTLSMDWHIRKKMGNVVRTVDRGLSASDQMVNALLLGLLPALGVGLASFIMVSQSLNQPVVAGICFIAFGVYSWATFLVTAWRGQVQSAMNEEDSSAHDDATDALVNFETVKCFTNEEHESKRYISSVRRSQNSNFDTQASISVLNVSQSLIIQLATLGCMFVAAYTLYHQQQGFTVGGFVAILSYVMAIFVPLEFLGYNYSIMMTATVDLQKMAELLSEKPDVVDDADAPDILTVPCPCDYTTQPASGKPKQAPTDTDGGNIVVMTEKSVPRPPGGLLMNDCRMAIEFRDVSFRYPTAPEGSGLKRVSFVVPAGTTTAIVGTTGSGKSSTLKLALRFYDVTGGAILFNGVDIRRVSQKSVRRLIGVVPQDTCMFNESILYNIRYGNLDAPMEAVYEAAKMSHLHQFVERLDLKYGTMCGERGLKLSGGEKQRLAIARCLIKNPPIVFLDEATSALDNKTEREVQAALQCLEGRTTLVVAHRLTTVQNADQILVMDDGAIIERGTHDALLAKGPGGAYFDMWNAQQQRAAVSAAAEQSPTSKTEDATGPLQ